MKEKCKEYKFNDDEPLAPMITTRKSRLNWRVGVNFDKEGKIIQQKSNGLLK